MAGILIYTCLFYRINIMETYALQLDNKKRILICTLQEDVKGNRVQGMKYVTTGHIDYSNKKDIKKILKVLHHNDNSLITLCNLLDAKKLRLSGKISINTVTNVTA